METYIDKNYAVTANTICSYFGLEENLRIPTRFLLIDADAIGHGAFCENHKLKTVMIPKEIKTLGKGVFRDCENLQHIIFENNIEAVGEATFYNCLGLKTIEFSALLLSTAEYVKLKNHSILLEDGTHVSQQMPWHIFPQNFQQAFLLSGYKIGSVKPPTNIPNEISALLCREFPKHKEPFPPLPEESKFWKIKAVWKLDAEQEQEHQLFLQHIPYADKECLSLLAEKNNDKLIKSETNKETERVMIFSFDDSQTKKVDGQYQIHATIKIGYFFWQSAKRVICNGKEYFVYRRHHLTSQTDLEYIRQDIAIYSRKNIICNKAEVENVYAKYRLLSYL